MSDPAPRAGGHLVAYVAAQPGTVRAWRCKLCPGVWPRWAEIAGPCRPPGTWSPACPYCAIAGSYHRGLAVPPGLIDGRAAAFICVVWGWAPQYNVKTRDLWACLSTYPAAPGGPDQA